MDCLSFGVACNFIGALLVASRISGSSDPVSSGSTGVPK